VAGPRRQQPRPKHLLLEQTCMTSEQVLHGKLQAEKNEVDELRFSVYGLGVRV